MRTGTAIEHAAEVVGLMAIMVHVYPGPPTKPGLARRMTWLAFMLLLAVGGVEALVILLVCRENGMLVFVCKGIARSARSLVTKRHKDAWDS